MKLHELHINNFKFFPSIDTESPLLKIDGKNLLIYGENGSGKSTIYWALYTLLESSIKRSDDDIRKYFNKTGKESLVNIYADTGRSDAYVKAVLKDLELGTTKTYKVSRKQNDLRIRSNVSAQESNMASDFLNYRVLLGLHNLKNSVDNDLFKWFKDEVLQYVKIGTEVSLEQYKKLIEGPAKYLNSDGDEVFPTASLRTHPNPAERIKYADYQSYKQKVNEWNGWFKSFLEDITLRANKLIEEDFEFDFQFKFVLTKLDFKLTADKYETIEPVVYFKITEYNGVTNPKINKPHTFLNEAKWSAVGLAIRLSILDIKLYTADLKCLVLDDMLLSLDMSNRDIVLNILLDKYADDYQLIMLTHDRYFFELTKGKINARNKSDSWIKWEMYEDFSNGKFNPLILKSKTNLERAKNFFKQKEFPASSNHMRKATENFVYEYVPKNKQYDRNFRPLDLSALIGKSRVVARANGLPMILIQNLDLMRTNIFNPGSHHDVYTPVFESELKKAIETLEEVSRLTGITL